MLIQEQMLKAALFEELSYIYVFEGSLKDPLKREWLEVW